MIKNLKHLIKKSLLPTEWDLTNKILYDACKTYPNHTDISEITAKVFIIGRSYAAALERRRNKDANDTNDFYLDKAGPIILKSNLDKNLELLKKMTLPDHHVILKTHKKLTDTFTKISGLEKRSLASKYLHFHFPNLFYIYDSRALKGLSKVSSALGKNKNSTNGYDKGYANFYFRCNELQRFIRTNTGALLTPRQLDNLLLLIETESR